MLNIKQTMQDFLARMLARVDRQQVAMTGAWSEDGVLRGLFPLCFVPDMAASDSQSLSELLNEFSADSV